MATHSDIIERAGGVTEVRRKLEKAGIVLPDETVRSWPKRAGGSGSIPGEYWSALADCGVATLEELALAAERRRFPDRMPAEEAMAS